jgi:vacuolar protein sorting-associated protein 13A/C
MILILDVVLDAPVIVMPLNSSSVDQLEVDLGTLEVRNRMMWEWRQGSSSSSGLSEGSSRSDGEGRPQQQQRLLLDDLHVKLSKVSGCVIAGQKRGRNVIREMGGGIFVNVLRPVLADPLPAPPLTTAVNMPRLRLSMLDTEYKLILDVLAANFLEPVNLPPELAALQEHLLDLEAATTAAAAAAPELPVQASQPAAAGAWEGSTAGEAPAGSSSAAAAPASGPAGGEQDEGTRAAQAASVQDFKTSNAALLQKLGDLCAVKTTINIGHAKLMLWNEQEGGPPLPLGSIEVGNMWLVISNTQKANMLLSLCLPEVCARDLRPGVPKEASLVLSTAEIGSGAAGGALAGTGAVAMPGSTPAVGGIAAAAAAANAGSSAGFGAGEQSQLDDKQAAQHAAAAAAVESGLQLLPSLLTLQYRLVKSISQAELVSGLEVRLQRPTLVVDIGFILKVLQFVVPTMGETGPRPRPYETREVHLGAKPYLAPDHLWLSPEYRIIADAPGVEEFVYDGRGHALVLPAALPAMEHVPLIVVGRGKVLRLRNVRVGNRGALAACLSLGAGARLIAEEADGVRMLDNEDEMLLGKKFQR